ncbi:MAG TPA: potassium transporter Trk, partial [Betaproteobacteria bacterium]|nr:potassium transporter Trk [Betaproteobacteria bacterium]
MNRLLPTAHVIGLTLMLFSLAYLMPIVSAIWYSDGTEWEFLVSMTITLASGYAIWVVTRRFQRELKPRDGFLLVVLLWTVIAAFATLPLMA